MPPEPSPGEMILHPEIRPLVGPGRRRLTLEQTFTIDGSPRRVQEEVHHLEVTGPRVTMPGTELFSVSPPPNAEGAFAGRLAQVALRRRTLPWERSGDDGPPWLALVILTDEEGTYRPDVPVADAFGAGVAATLDGLDDGPERCDALEVLTEVVDRTFPARGELEALCHVRQVALGDTEYADEDGFVSVVICNRLPQPGTRYAAYLISLEGQLDVLPEPGAVADDPGPAWVFEAVLEHHDRPGIREIIDGWHVAHDVGGIVAGPATPGPGPAPTPGPGPAPTPGPGPVLGRPTPGMPVLPVTGTRSEVGGPLLPRSTAARRVVRADARATAGPTVAAAAAYTIGLVADRIDHRAVADLFRIGATTRRFPVLARWEFACTEEERDLRAYLRGVDIGLLGEEVADPGDDLRPLRSTETGHLPLDHVDRLGRRASAWYRGPLSPLKITRGDAVPLHHADQARTLVPGADGVTEDLGYAAAFEVGRLLGMADLAFVTGVRRLVAARFVRPGPAVVHERFRDLMAWDRVDPAALRELHRRLAQELLLEERLGPLPIAGLGDPLPPHELDRLLSVEADIGVLSEGLGLAGSAVEAALGATLTGPIDQPAVAERPVVDFETIAAGPLGVVGDLHERLTFDVADHVRELAGGERLLAAAGHAETVAAAGPRLEGGFRGVYDRFLGAVEDPTLLGHGDRLTTALLDQDLAVVAEPGGGSVHVAGRAGGQVALGDLARIARLRGGPR